MNSASAKKDEVEDVGEEGGGKRQRCVETVDDESFKAWISQNLDLSVSRYISSLWSCSELCSHSFIHGSNKSDAALSQLLDALRGPFAEFESDPPSLPASPVYNPTSPEYVYSQTSPAYSPCPGTVAMLSPTSPVHSPTLAPTEADTAPDFDLTKVSEPCTLLS